MGNSVRNGHGVLSAVGLLCAAPIKAEDPDPKAPPAKAESAPAPAKAVEPVKEAEPVKAVEAVKAVEPAKPVPPPKPQVAAAPPPSPACPTKIGRIYLSGNITARTSAFLMSALQTYINNNYNEVWLVVNSPGGETSAAFNFYYESRKLPITLNTYAAGSVASAATTIFLSGKQRLVSPATQVMIHPNATVLQGNFQQSALDQFSASLKNSDSGLLQIYHEVTGLPESRFAPYFDGHDRTINAKTVLDLRLASGFGTPPIGKGAAIVEINENSYWTPVLPVNDC